MAPNRGIAAHFAASKASISRSTRSVKSKPVKDVAAPAPATHTVSQPPSQQSMPALSSNDASSTQAAAVELKAPTTPKKSTPRRQTRTRLRTPDEGEVDRIMAENESLLQSSPSSRPAPSSFASEDLLVPLLGAPPTTPRASARSASRLSPLLEPSHISPISVRTDPDTNKMYLMLSRSPAKASSSSSAVANSSSPTKRKLATPPKSTSPTKTPRTLDGTPRRLITGEPERLGTEEEDGLVLTPGRAKGTRVMLGSPSKSPLLSKLGDTPRGQALRRIVDEDDEAYITPRGVRQRPKGIPLPPMATQSAAAVFRGAQLPASSSAPSLGQPPTLSQAASSSSLNPTGLSHSEIEPLGEEDQTELPQPKHVLSSDLALPSFYSSIMTLHVALEHALVVHLATAGCASATLESSAQASDEDDFSDPELPHRQERKRTKTVRLPNLISYTALRPLVERSGGRRLGPTELKRLASVWVDFQRSSAALQQGRPEAALKGEEQEEVRGLGFIISKTRSMDARTGRRALDWGIGIELEIKRTIRERTPPTQVNFGGVEVQASPVLPSSAEGFDESVKGTPKMPASRFSTPPPPSLSSSTERQALRSPYLHQPHASSSPLLASPRRKMRAASPTPASPKTRSSVGAVKAREGMSVVAMWNNGLETRKAEVGRRLRERCARFHQLWLDEKGISVPVAVKSEPQEPSTPSSRRSQKQEQEHQTIGLGIASAADSDDDDNDEDEAGRLLPREAIMGAGGLLTPSATRSGGRRVGKRMFHMDPSELDRDGLASSGEDEDDDAGLARLRGGNGGKQSLIEEVSGSVVRSSRSMPQLRATSANAVATEKAGEAGEIPAEGELLHAWHPDFPLDDPRVVKPVPLATLPSLTATLATPHRNKDKTLFGGGLDPLTPKKPVKYISAVPLAASTSVTPAAPAASTAGLTLRERIQAKEQLRRTASLPSLAPSASSSTASSSTLTPMQALSQRALVSRLPELCSILFMLFSNGTTLSSTGITRSPTIPMHDLLTKLAKSVKIQLSARECRSAIDVLAKIAPGFLLVINPTDGASASAAQGGGKEYVRLGNNAQTGTLWRLNEVRARIAVELNGK
ncbi:hypothetical protein EX895_002596 [Sporisorium graminicola]|uniref:DNA replication factor Cdt1 C-terminal domain-containing protein n=1 Tax=Sporisorium graminicola TaxID=280036 RepID=A0A4U7KWP9_9BASI|nr:hypothetical protein EX895_002596 [Sporisorium graminicola]TKY88607.1 hypothetical protein EX895_002596 [Sporisorium graminicola]